MSGLLAPESWQGETSLWLIHPTGKVQLDPAQGLCTQGAVWSQAQPLLPATPRPQVAKQASLGAQPIGPAGRTGWPGGPGTYGGRPIRTSPCSERASAGYQAKSLRNRGPAPGPGVTQAWAGSALGIRDLPTSAAPSWMPRVPHFLADQPDSRTARPRAQPAPAPGTLRGRKARRAPAYRAGSAPRVSGRPTSQCPEA